MNIVGCWIRRVAVVSSCAAIPIVVGIGGLAHAAPDGIDPGSCVYKLSTPFVVEVSGVKMVSATLSSLPCSGDILPNSQTVCVQLQGSSAAPQCVNQPGYTTAQVYFTPYRAGSTYVSTGTGCGNGGKLFLTACATQGPYEATL